MTNTTRFSGEDGWDAIVNDNSMDIEEEEEFLRWCEDRRTAFDLEHLETAYKEFRELTGAEGVKP